MSRGSNGDYKTPANDFTQAYPHPSPTVAYRTHPQASFRRYPFKDGEPVFGCVSGDLELDTAGSALLPLEGI